MAEFPLDNRTYFIFRMLNRMKQLKLVYIDNIDCIFIDAVRGARFLIFIVLV